MFNFRCIKATNSILQYKTIHNFMELTKLSCKYSTTNNSKTDKIPDASRWRNVRGCVKPEPKQKQLKFTSNSSAQFDLLKPKGQMQIIC